MFLLAKRPLKSSERVLKSHRRFTYGAVAGVFILLAALFFASWGSRRDEVTIADIQIAGAASVSEKEIRAFMDGELSGAYGGLFSRSNSLIYPKKAITRGLLLNFPHIASLALARSSFRALSVTIEEREPAYLWCGEIPPSSNENIADCYFLDPHGVVFAKAPHFSGSVYFEMYGALSDGNVFEESPHEPPIGFLFLPPADFNRIVSFKNALEESGMPPEKLVLKEENDAEFIFSNSTRLIFNLRQNFDMVLRNLLAALEAQPLSKKVFIGTEKVFDYADARFENRVFYK